MGPIQSTQQVVSMFCLYFTVSIAGEAVDPGQDVKLAENSGLLQRPQVWSGDASV